MKTIPLLASLMGSALMVTGAEPAATNSPPVKTELSASKDLNSAGQTSVPIVPDERSLQKVGERITLSGALTKAPPSKARTLGEMFNPFAPVEPQPKTPWVERAAWSTVAATAPADAMPEEVRHESRFGVSIASR